MKHSPTRRILFLTTPQSYRTAAFVEAAKRLEIETLLAVDLPKQLAEEWKQRLGVDFHRPEDAAAQIASALAERPVDAILSLDDSGSLAAAAASQRLGLPHNAGGGGSGATNW
ncbi:MAG: hypothetical protein R2856_29135 [Caldilineaceae bacterium]